MNRKEILNELMKKYSFEKAHSIRQIATEDREFENDDVYIIMTRTLDGDISLASGRNEQIKIKL